MYSGTTLNKTSGNLVGTHQRINRIVHKRLASAVCLKNFPELKLIQHFEGNNGPDALKRKSPAKDEVAHFCNPYSTNDELYCLIENHYQALVKELKKKNMERAAFEASWLAHALVDGLTPAHHFPYEARVAELRGSHEADCIRKKVLFQGSSFWDTLQRNWSFWGAKGTFTSHFLFEWGVAAIGLIATSLHKPSVGFHDVQSARQQGICGLFETSMRRVAELNMYDRFCSSGWTLEIARDVQSTLLPELVETVTLAWASAMHEAGHLNPART